MEARRRIALLVESSRAYGRNLLRGIAAYARAHGPWSFYHEERAVRDPAPRGLAAWGAVGILARLETERQIQQVRSLGLPTVDLFGLHRLPKIPLVEPDQEAIALLAIEHFRQRGLTDLAYCGFPGLFFSDARERFFASHVTNLGLKPHIFAAPPVPQRMDISVVEARSVQQVDRLAAWLRNLPKPTGVMACNDMRALEVMGVCAHIGIRIPGEIALLGVDNDEVQCELAEPPLTSIDPAAEQIGYRAAAILDGMLSGRAPPSQIVRLPPARIVERRSTDMLAVADPDVAAALHYIRGPSLKNLKVDDVARHVALSRSTLERRFRTHGIPSPAEEIARTRIERMKDLLRTTDLRLTGIAERLGFDHLETMCRLFKRHTGQTPGAYRRQARL
jgi:LacI family transcriptional regulator